MFTGLVEELGTVRGTARGRDSARISIEAAKILGDMNTGDSIAVNGVCLTAVEFDRSHFVADVMSETMAKTNLAALKPGDRVNLERALRLGDRLGGHIVSGHIDGVGSILRREKHDIATLITISAPPQVMKYIIKKGSVAIDGTSLTVVGFTVANNNEGSFQVSLIPHTAHMTTLGMKKAGDTVNLEGDLIGKYIERLLDARRGEEPEKAKSGISMNYLLEKGFI